MRPESPAAAELLYQELFENSYDMQFTCDLEGRITAANLAVERTTGYSRAELLRMNVAEIVAPVNKEHDGGARPTRPAAGTRELEIRTKEGGAIPVEIATKPIDQSGREVGTHSVAREIRERKQVEEQLLRLASHDPLTGLFNRQRFEEELQVHLAQARRMRVQGALLFLDLDFFKDVNDSLGHRFGDQVLSQVAQLFHQSFPERAILGRLGGDEFGVIIPELSVDDAEPVARKALIQLQNGEIGVPDHQVTVTASIGITQVPMDGYVTAAELLSRADIAMYGAKEGGRNRVVVYDTRTDWQAQLEADLLWRRKISEALDKGLFVLFAQPILSLADNRISGCELLIRLRDAEGRIVAASDFISKAEHFGLIRAIDRWVVEEAVDLLSRADQLETPPRIAFNISGGSLGDSELLEKVRSSLDSSGADPAHLVIEVTESACIQNLAEAQRFVREVRSLGCQVALDDFGVGSSSFAHLKLLGVDYLKIDGAFIRNIASDTTDRELVKAIVAIGRALGKKIVAEYVVDEQTLDIVRELGVDYAQGYYIGEPQDAREFLFGTRGGLVRRAA